MKSGLYDLYQGFIYGPTVDSLLGEFLEELEGVRLHCGDHGV